MAGMRAFLNTFVVWHPDFSDEGTPGVEIAEALYREFSRDPDRPMSPAIGIPLYFRTSPAGGVPPPPIDTTAAEFTLLVFLTDASMVLDDAYVAYAQQLATRAANEPRTRILTCVFPKSGRLQLGPIQQVQLPADSRQRHAMLRLKVAAECCRLLQDRPRSGDAAGKLSKEPPKLFISHAKRDARDIAKDLKSQVEDKAIDTFFDEVDIAAGYDFTDEIKESIKRSAVLAWQSDEYASRPWCNIELLTAKEHLRPIVVASGLKLGEERSFPYLGNVRTIVATGENTTEIIIAAVREYLRKLHSDGRFEMLAAHGAAPRADFCLFRPPEPVDAALLERKSANAGSAPGPKCVLYPDPPLSAAESDLLGRLFPNIRFTTPATFERKSLNGLKVALSLSLPEAADLLASGIFAVHLQAAMIEIARNILSRGGIVAYGGDLRDKAKYGFTRELFELVRAYKDLDRPALERIRNYLAYPIAAELPKEEESTLIELARFEKVLPPDVAAQFGLDSKLRQRIPDDTPENRYIRARCLTGMREAMAADTDARVVLGGRVSGQQGIYPGILEESCLTLRAGKPLYIIGAFGGCARAVIETIRDKHRPDAFSREYQAKHPRTARITAADGSVREETVTFAQLESSYQAYGAAAPDSARIDYDRCVETLLNTEVDGLDNGLNAAENLELFATADLDRTVALVMKGLSARFPRA